MAPYVQKGGLWKNTEDEILKAAVMKYGLNQWARISSLLVRKTPKQCKSRWQEWLDPSIKKTSWTRQEEEKLIHLAKVMPCQWRTIAPLVGRTAAQCLAHYSDILEKATGADISSSRKPMAGDIDPDAESRPARPDAVDMDDDEKEMLQEARARLANTKGKKAKRKARERQLRDAKRLTQLQKKRELKAAGIDLDDVSSGRRKRPKKRKAHVIDYSAEIALEKKAPKGFFDTTAEDLDAKQQKQESEESFVPTSLIEIEGARRDAIEAAERKKDEARHKLLKKHNLPKYAEQIHNLNSSSSVKSRPAMSLPLPQISAEELSSISGIGSAGFDSSGFGSVPPVTPAPIRTPSSEKGVDSIMIQARNLAALTNAQTPLAGGVNPQMTPVSSQSMEGGSVTPNAFASSRASISFRGTPIRDELNINTPLHGAAENILNLRSIRMLVRAGLKSLPSPKNVYEVEPQSIPDVLTPSASMEVDAEEELELARILQAETEEKRLLSRSSVFRNSLPIPTQLPKFSYPIINDDLIDVLSEDLELTDVSESCLSYDQLESARALIEENVCTEVGDTPELDYVFLQDEYTSVKISDLSPDQLDAHELNIFDSCTKQLTSFTRQCDLLESKHSIVLAPVRSKLVSSLATLAALVQEYNSKRTDLQCFELLLMNEVNALRSREEYLGNLVLDASAHDIALQKVYRHLAN